MKSPSHAPRTSAVLTAVLAAHPGPRIRLGDLIEPLHERAFGFLLVILALPNFVPVPVGIGGPVGLLVALVGLQLLLGRLLPWLPRRLADYRIARGAAQKIVAFGMPLLTRLEKLARPRLERLTRRPASLLTGLLLLLIGALLALPIPFTNWPIGAGLLLYGVALTERDGALLLALWLASLAGITALLVLSNALLHTLQGLY